MSYTYLIIDVDSRLDEAGWVAKIGKSDDPIKRCRALQTANAGRLALAATIPGAEWEPLLHAMLDRFRINGEWFRLDLGRLQLVASLADEHCRGALECGTVDFNLFGSLRPHQYVAADDHCFSESEAFHEGWAVGEAYERSRAVAA